jgi:5-methylcytosine-specific restriction enzyme A
MSIPRDNPYHSPEWQALRRQVLLNRPVCALCRMKRATHVDHIKPHRGNLVLFLDPRNLQALCWSCHSSKTFFRDGGFGRPRSESRPIRGTAADGMPTDTEHHWNK